MTVLMGRRDHRVLARACDLGAAMQLTNICRDVGEDARNGRVYLPLQWLRDAGVDPDALTAHPAHSEALGAVVDRALREADGLYRGADLGVAMLPRDSRVAIRAARLLYSEIGAVVRGEGNGRVTARAVVPGAQALAAAARQRRAAHPRPRAPRRRPPALPAVRVSIWTRWRCGAPRPGPRPRALVRAVLSRVNDAVCKNLRETASDTMPAFTDGAEPVVARNAERAARQLGTLGGGNHFAELARAVDGDAWLLVHSGSRGLGQAVNGHYHSLAEALCARLGLAHPASFPVLPVDSSEGQGYLAEQEFCLRYAEANRELIRAACERSLHDVLGDYAVELVVQTHHNFLSKERWEGRDVYVHRKGAVAAPKGAYVTIPGSMETSSFLCRGTGCALSHGSVSHGAGRARSRGQMMPKVLMTDEKGEVFRDKGGYARVDREATERAKREAADVMEREMSAKGITLVTHDTAGVIDERAHGYKDVHAVIAAQHELLEVVCELTPIGVVKSFELSGRRSPRSRC